MYKNTNFSIEAHVPTPRYGLYLTHTYNHITSAVAAMDSWHCRRVYERTNPSTIKDPSLPRRAQRSTPLSVSSTAKLVRVVQCKNWYFFKTIWAHRSTFAISSSYACRGRTVLRFPTNSYHLFTVELVLKQCFFALASEIEGLCYTDSPVHI